MHNVNISKIPILSKYPVLLQSLHPTGVYVYLSLKSIFISYLFRFFCIISFSLSVNSLFVAHFGHILLTNLCDIDVAKVLAIS